MFGMVYLEREAVRYLAATHGVTNLDVIVLAIVLHDIDIVLELNA